MCLWHWASSNDHELQLAYDAVYSFLRRFDPKSTSYRIYRNQDYGSAQWLASSQGTRPIGVECLCNQSMLIFANNKYLRSLEKQNEAEVIQRSQDYHKNAHQGSCDSPTNGSNFVCANGSAWAVSENRNEILLPAGPLPIPLVYLGWQTSRRFHSNSTGVLRWQKDILKV